MNDKRYLYRGFHPDEKGKTTIVVNGAKVKGEWIFWDCFGCCTKSFARTVRAKRVRVDYLFPSDIIPETVGQWVTTDKNGKNVFEGDMVKTNFYGKECGTGRNFNDYDIFNVAYKEYVFCVENENRRFRITHETQRHIELIENKWECKV